MADDTLRLPSSPGDQKVKYLPLADAGAPNADRFALSTAGAYKASTTVLAATTLGNATNTTVDGAAVSGFGMFRQLVFLLTVSAKAMGAGTVDIYVETSPDDGTTWDDVMHFAQITVGAIPNGTYIGSVARPASAGFNPRATAIATLAASTRVDYFADKVRVSTVTASTAGGDVVTVKVTVIGLS